MDVMPVVGHAVLRRILAHRRNPDAVTQLDRTDGQRLEQMPFRNRIFIHNVNRLQSTNLEARKLSGNKLSYAASQPPTSKGVAVGRSAHVPPAIHADRLAGYIAIARQ